VHRLSILLVLAACGAPETTDEPNEADLIFAERLADGPFTVGYQQVDVEYVPATADGPREIQAEVWYPAEPGAPEAEYEVGGIIGIDAPLATTGALAEPGEAPYPLAVYSHGSGGVGLVGYPFAEYLASWGWVVIAPDHKGNTALELASNAGAPFLKVVIERPQDVSASIDWIEANEPFASRTDTASTLVVGHSFGGYTALALAGARPSPDRVDPGCPDEEDPSCPLFEDPDVQNLLADGFLDDRVAAIVPQAPAVGFFDPDAIASVELPTMLQSGGLDITTPPEQSSLPAWAALDGPEDVWIDMPTGGHVTFLSICDDLSPLLLDTLQPGAEDDGCGERFIDIAEALPVLEAYVGLFGDAHVRGQATASVIEEVEPPEGFVLELP